MNTIYDLLSLLPYLGLLVLIFGTAAVVYTSTSNRIPVPVKNGDAVQVRHSLCLNCDGRTNPVGFNSCSTLFECTSCKQRYLLTELPRLTKTRRSAKL